MDMARECFEKIFSAKEQDEIKTHAFKIGVNLLAIPLSYTIITLYVMADKPRK